ncbi:MAG TPA: TIR domain-containing protein, partial [Thermoanaerobaculia bacterium]|nr:TIR domain-containing protein [Thermoanaerobaculia bacterium]
MEKAQFDVFLSHNSADKPAIEALARRLEEAGVRCWLDKWNLIPGEPWQEAIEQALEQCSVCAVFWGPKGAGRWEDEEMRAAIERRIAEGREGGRPRFRVVPVLLPGARLDGGPRLPAFVSRLTWVDFKTGLDDPEAFQRLLAGIHGNAPGGSVGPARVERAAAAEPAEQKAEKRQLRPLLWALLAAGLLALGLLLWLLWRHLSFPATLDSALDRANAEIQRGDPRAALRTLEEIERRHLANPADPRPFLEKANAYQVLSQFDRQRDAAIQADALAERLQNHGYIAEALLLQGMAQAQLGNPKEALTAFERAGTICAGEECPLEQAEALSNIAILQLQQGDFETARRSFERALGLFEALGDHDREALQNNALGVIALEQGNLGEGAKRFEQAQREYAETGNRVGQGEA